MNDFIELRSILLALLRRWWLLILTTFVAGSLGYGFSLLQTPIYKATASMAVNQVIEANSLKYSDIETIEQLIRTNADLAIRQPILDRVVETLALPESWQQLQIRVRAMPLENSQVLEISAEASTSEEAVNIANQVAQQLLFFNTADTNQGERQAQSTFAQSRLVELERQIAASQQQLNTLKGIQADTALTDSNTDLWNLWLSPDASINPLDPSGERSRKLAEEIARIERLITEWEKSYDRWKIVLQENSSFKALTIVESAQASLTQVRPRTGINIILASAIGLVLALCLIALLEYLDDTLKFTDDIAQLMNAPVLGSIRQMKSTNKNKLLLYQDAPSPAEEDYRMLHSKIQLMCTQLPKTILVTSLNAGDGRSTVAANLGVAAAQFGYRTIVVDADWKRPIQHDIFQIPSNKGLEELLFKPTESDIPLWTIDRLPNLTVLASGYAAGHAKSVEAGEGITTTWWRAKRMGQVLTQLTDHSDVIIIDSPPLLMSADAAALAGQVDGVILIVEADRTKRTALQEVCFALEQAQANLIGVVFNRATMQMSNNLLSRSKVAAPAVTPNKLLTVKAPLSATSNGNGVVKQKSPTLKRHRRVVQPLRFAKIKAEGQNGANHIANHIMAKQEKVLTFEQLGIDALTLQGKVNLVNVPLFLVGGQTLADAEQVELDIVTWLDDTAITTATETKRSMFLDVAWNGTSLGSVALDKSGTHTATLVIPSLPPISRSEYTSFLHLSLRSNDKQSLAPGVTVVVLSTSRLVFLSHRRLEMTRM